VPFGSSAPLRVGRVCGSQLVSIVTRHSNVRPLNKSFTVVFITAGPIKIDWTSGFYFRIIRGSRGSGGLVPFSDYVRVALGRPADLCSFCPEPEQG
jgi:hypothetical protein